MLPLLDRSRLLLLFLPSRDFYLAVGRKRDVQIADGILGESSVVPGFFHEGQTATWILSVVSDLEKEISISPKP